MNNGISHKNGEKIVFLVKLHHNMAITEKILIDSSFIFLLSFFISTSIKFNLIIQQLVDELWNFT